MTATRAGRARGDGGASRAESDVLHRRERREDGDTRKAHAQENGRHTPRITKSTRPERRGDTEAGEASYLGQSTRCRVRSERRGSTPTIYMVGERRTHMRLSTRAKPSHCPHARTTPHLRQHRASFGDETRPSPGVTRPTAPWIHYPSSGQGQGRDIASLRILLTLASQYGWKIDHMNVATAFLHPDRSTKRAHEPPRTGRTWRPF